MKQISIATTDEPLSIKTALQRAASDGQPDVNMSGVNKLWSFSSVRALVGRISILVLCIMIGDAFFETASADERPETDSAVVFGDVDGVIAVEAEHFFRQTLTKTRRWHLVTSKRPKSQTDLQDGDPPHIAGASGGAYLEILPDTRRTHQDKLIKGQNFSNEPGKLAILDYKVNIPRAGRYFVWVRAYSTGSEDNGLHVGLDGKWPASGQRLQWCAGKNSWRWESKQRTQKEHCGEPHKIFLDIEKPGLHTIHFSMREDGFEFDKWLLVPNRDYFRPEGVGPKSVVHAGKMPATLALVPAPTKSVDVSDNAAQKMNWPAKVQPRQPNGDGSVAISGELKQWHKVTFTLNGLFAHERDQQPNPFTDVSFHLQLRHEDGTEFTVPGYFAADGNAGNTGAKSGTKWRAHFTPNKSGKWSFSVSFLVGKNVFYDEESIRLASPFYGTNGSFVFAASDKSGRDFRGQGTLQYVGERYLRFAGSGKYFLKAGPDAPETLLAYADFDDTVATKKNSPIKTWKPHLQDWKPGDPTWKNGKGKGLIGALNYLASQGCNSVSFLPYNAGGDGNNVWPFVVRESKLNYDCSKLDQWQIVFDHATRLGIHLHFKLQENEMDDNRLGLGTKPGNVAESLDGGKLGIERRLYCKELVARFGYQPALLWNLGEENTQTPAEQRAMISYLTALDPYHHNIVIHSYPQQQDKLYNELLGKKSLLTGASLQNSWQNAHQRTLKWIQASQESGRPWVVCNDEQNPASHGVPPDPGYKGHDGFAVQNGKKYDLHDIRKYCLWGTLMAGGAGVEYYFGYKLPENDLVCQDFRSREKSWEYCKIALEFFEGNSIPIREMKNADDLIGNPRHTNSRYCFAKTNRFYLIYLPSGGTTSLNLKSARGQFEVRWFDPRTGGQLQQGTVKKIAGGGASEIGRPPSDQKNDWVAIVRLVTSK